MKKLIPLLLILSLLLSGCRNAPVSDTVPSTGAVIETVPAEEDAPYLYVHYIDVGQADSILLKVGDCDILIDGGNVADGSAVVNYLARQGVDDLELVIATHAHEDHAGGLTRVLKKFIAEEVWVTTAYFSTSSYTNFINTIGDQGLPISIPAVGEVYTWGDLTLTVLGPVDDYTETETNNTSLVVMVQYGERRFLFTGDMESDAERDLVYSGADLHADVLKVGHHGSYSSSSNLFLNAVSATYGVISVGADNDYGHPHNSAMNRLFTAGMTLCRTDTMGSIVIATDGEDLAFMWTNSNAQPQTALWEEDAA